MKIIFLLLILSWFNPCFANPCNSILLHRLAQNEGVDWETPGIFQKESERLRSGLTQFRIARMRDEELLGILSYTKPEKETIHIEWMEAAEEHRQKGIGKLLFWEMIRDNPDTKKIESILMFENLKAAEKDLKEELSCVQLVQRTPAYKIRKAFGYSKIVDCFYIKGALIGFVVALE